MTAGQVTLIATSAIVHAAADTTNLALVKLRSGHTAMAELRTEDTRAAMARLGALEAELKALSDDLRTAAL